ncbi:AAA family ATPase [Pseudolysinimonas sp.]|jgi:MinD-like ATPase involved in chromosome partitioning or flagellar assembly|uniref:MinD/ParA family ATP-binding protein n=1 Tax=Pseudolysinimonas sp. TaxID=2680009 RepID=UPI003785079F
MRKDQNDDLATALPSSLTVDLHLPEPVHEAPEDEAMVALDRIAAHPAVGPTAPTMSIEIVTSAVPTNAEPADETETPVEIVPLPEHPEPPAAAEVVPKKAAKPLKPGRKPRPEGSWPTFVYGATLHLVNLGDSRTVRARKALDARIAQPFGDGPRFVPVLSRKGGVGKTTITTLLGMALADVRADRVLAIDANPDRGTLADRVTKQTRSTVRDVVLHAPDLGGFDELSSHLSRDITGLDVAASDSDPLLAEAFDEDGYNVVADVVAPHYGVVVTDSGTGVVHSVMRATLQRADAVVVVSGGSIDEARLASETLTWLEANNYGALVANAVVALNASTQGTDLDKLHDIEEHFRSRVRAVVRIPYDPELAAGSIVRFEALRPFTRASARELAAVVVDGLGDRA